MLNEPESPPAPVVPIQRQRLGDAELIDRYVLSMRRRNLSPRSIDVVASALRDFSREHHGGFATATRQSVEAMLDKRNLQPRRRYWWLSCLHTFYGWAIDEELLEVDPTARIHRPKLTKDLPRPMPDEDLRLALDNAEPMVRCWLLLGAYEGLRCQEIAGLSREDVDEAAMTLRVVYGKGRKQRMLPLHADVLAALRALPMPASGAIFRRKRLLTRYPPAQLVQELNAYLNGLGIASTAHSLRHWFASHVYAETLDLRLTQEMMGHTSPDTTAIYTKADTSKSAPAVAALSVLS